MYFLALNDLHPVSHSCISYVKLNYSKNPYALYNVQLILICNICQHCINHSTQKTKAFTCLKGLYSPTRMTWLCSTWKENEQWLTPPPHQHRHAHFLWILQNQFFCARKRTGCFLLKETTAKNAFCFKQSSYAYYNTEFQTMLEEGIEGIFEHNNLLYFFLRSGRETIFSAYTADVDPYVSYF